MNIPEFPLPPTPPKVPLIPVSMRITTDTPEFGWWKWHLEFDEESFAGRAVIPWMGNERRHFSFDIFMSDVFDPIQELHDFCYCMLSVGTTLGISIDEEGRFVYLQRWILSDELIQFRAFSWGRQEDFQFDFIVNREDFHRKMQAAYCEFGAKGGWGFTECVTFGEDNEDEVIIDGNRHEKLIDKIALIYLKNGKILSSRSKGKDAYYIPGGKREGEESDEAALIREIRKKLSVDVIESSIRPYGIFHAQAHGNAEGVVVRMTCYTAEFSGELKPDNEIAEIVWLSYTDKEKSSPVDGLIFDDLHTKGLLK